MISPGDSQVTARAVGYVRQHADCIQSNVIEHVMSGYAGCGRVWARVACPRGLNLAPGMAPRTCSERSNYFA